MAATKREKTKTAKRTPAPKRAAPSVKKAKAGASRSNSPAKKSLKRIVASPRAKGRSSLQKTIVAAVPLLAATPKKVGKVAPAAKPAAPYQPKTDVAPLAKAGAKTAAATTSKTSQAAPAFDPLALARPWLQLGAQMAMANLNLQVRIAKAAMNLPSAAIGMRQGSAAYKMWLGMVERAVPAKA